MNRITQGRRSIFTQATKYVAEYNIFCNFDDTGTTISASKDPAAAIETKTITTPSPTALKELLRSKKQKNRNGLELTPTNNVKRNSCLSHQTKS